MTHTHTPRELEIPLAHKVVPAIRDAIPNADFDVDVHFIHRLHFGGLFYIAVVHAPIDLDTALNRFRSYEEGPGSTSDPFIVDGREFILGDGDDSSAVFCVTPEVAVIWLRHLND